MGSSRGIGLYQKAQSYMSDNENIPAELRLELHKILDRQNGDFREVYRMISEIDKAIALQDQSIKALKESRAEVEAIKAKMADFEKEGAGLRTRVGILLLGGGSLLGVAFSAFVDWLRSLADR